MYATNGNVLPSKLRPVKLFEIASFSPKKLKTMHR